MGSDGPDLAGAGCGYWSSDTSPQSPHLTMASLVSVEDTAHTGDKVWTHNDPPSLIAVSSIMTTLRPTIESSLVPILRDTPSPSSSSSSSSCHSSPLVKSDSDSPLERVISALQKMTMSETASVLTVMEKLEEIMRASLPPSPAQSEEEHPASSSSSIAPRALFPEETDPAQCST